MPKYKNHYVIVKRESRKDPPSSTSPKRKLPGIPHDLSTHTVTVTVDLSSSSDASASKTFKSKCFYSTSRTVTKEGLKKSPAPSTVQSCYARTIKSVSNMMDSIALPPLPPKVRLARRRIKLPRNEEPIDFALVFEPLFTLPKTEESKLSDREEFFDCNQCLNHVDRVAFNESSRVKRIKVFKIAKRALKRSTELFKKTKIKSFPIKAYFFRILLLISHLLLVLVLSSSLQSLTQKKRTLISEFL